MGSRHDGGAHHPRPRRHPPAARARTSDRPGRDPAPPRPLDALVRAHPGRPRTAKLRAALTEPPSLTRSELEERFLAICRTHDLPTPRTNAHVEGLEVDFLFAEHRLVIETDGWAYHRTRRAFERDRERDAALTRAGYTTLRFTGRQLQRGEQAAATITAALRVASSEP